MPYRLFMISPAFIAFLLLPASDCAGQAGRPTLQESDIGPLMRSDWYGLYLKGKKIGYFNTARERAGDVIRDRMTFNMKRAAFGLKSDIAITEVSIFENKAPYRMIGGEYEQRNDPAPLEQIALRRNQNGFEYTFRSGAEVSKKQIPDFDYTLADTLAVDLWVRTGPKEGDTATSKHFDLKDAKVYTQSSKVRAIKSSLVGGVNLRYFEIDNESNKDMLRFLTRHDEQGRILSSVIAIFELRLETEEQAKDTEYSQDLFVLGTVKSDRALGPLRKVSELVVQVSGDEKDVFEDGPRQSVSPGPMGARLIKLGKKYGKEALATKEEIAEALEETNVYCISHPKVKALAEQAVGDAATPEEKVRRIVQFVNGYVRPSISTTMPTIHDLMEKKQGDCKSYALMVTNLARAAKVPAREVAGLLYMGDDQKAFGGHAWNEVVLNGVWVPVDASLRETEIDATHVSFGTQQKAGKNLLVSLGKLSFKVVEFKSAN